MRIFGEAGCGGTSLGDSSLIHSSRAVVLTVGLPLFLLLPAFPLIHILPF